MRMFVIDTETTGLEPADQIVEFAAVEVKKIKGEWVQEVDPFSSLFRPTVPIGTIARATHHITDEELESAPALFDDSEQRRRVLEMTTDPKTVLVAHNMNFDKRMLEQSGFPVRARVICTYRCARIFYPDAPAYGNQVLRYHLGLYVPPVDGPPHRAKPDAVVTASLLMHMLGSAKTANEMNQLMSTPQVLTICNIGKNKGKPWADVDSGMLNWILGKDFDEDVKHTCRYHLELRRAKK